MIPQDLAQLEEPRRGARFRDEWLTHVAVLVRPWFSARGYEIPLRLRIGVGALSVNSRTVGVFFDSPDRDGYRHITISPFIDDPVTVALVLIHELIHAIMPADEVHGARFQAAASAIGFQRPFTQIHPHEALRRHVEVIVRRVGPYPHRSPSRTMELFSVR